MRQKHLKFHAAALGAICILIVLLYLLFGPEKAGPVEEIVGDRFIQIDNATWGKNCDPYVETALKNWTLPAQSDPAKPAKKPVAAVHNNALTTISALCNGKLSCRVLADTATFKIDPLETCFKRLTVGYRCFTFDRLWNVEVSQGANLDLNCREDATAKKAQ